VNWLFSNLDLVWALTLEHIRLSAIPIALGFVIAVPLGWVAWRYRWSRGTILTLVGLLYTIPSLALFVLLPPILGISFLSEINVIIALTIYAVALMVRSATDALSSVEADVRASATAVGYAGWGRFWSVELPLAGPVLLAGLRVVSVSTVSLLTVGVLIGTNSLGYLFTNGLQRGIAVEIVTGIIVTMLVALLFDLILVLLGRLLMPWLPFVQAQRGRRPSV
jgi:osmoprotectant transport system permease protein